MSTTTDHLYGTAPPAGWVEEAAVINELAARYELTAGEVYSVFRGADAPQRVRWMPYTEPGGEPILYHGVMVAPETAQAMRDHLAASRARVAVPQAPLPTVTCYSWCAWGDGHPDQVHHEDQNCQTIEERTPVTFYPSVEQHDGTHEPEYVTVFGVAHHHDYADFIHVGVGEGTGIKLTPAEARKVAAALLATADTIESKEAAR